MVALHRLIGGSVTSVAYPAYTDEDRESDRLRPKCAVLWNGRFPGTLQKEAVVQSLTVEEYRQWLVNTLRSMWPEMVAHCREVGEPEPDPAILAEWEAEVVNSRGPEMMVEHDIVAKAWSYARRSGDPSALKCEKELMDSIASGEHWDIKEWFEMQKKW
jgi:hypothetical protein